MKATRVTLLAAVAAIGLGMAIPSNTSAAPINAPAIANAADQANAVENVWWRRWGPLPSWWAWCRWHPYRC
jgi:hypothetical protein